MGKVAWNLSHMKPEELIALKRGERKTLRSVVVFCCALMFVNYLDRTNLAFASVQLNQDLGLTHSTYGLGAGLFFASYASMQVPAQMVMSKIGGPIWLGTIALAWGIVAASFAAMRTIPQFLALRFLLGLTEAGALPGMWTYLSHFYPKQRITVPLGFLMGTLIISQALGAPIAAGLMSLDGHGGLRGWQWLFLIEGVLACMVAFSFFFSPKNIDTVPGITQEERDAMHHALANAAKPTSSTRAALLGALRNPAVYAAAIIKFLRDLAFYGLLYWMPLVIGSIIDQGMHINKAIGSILLTAIPFFLSAAMQFATSYHSQLRDERRVHLVCFWAFAAVCLALLPLPEMKNVPIPAFVLLILGVVGVFGVEGISVSYYLALMGGEKGIGIAVINSIGALGGLVGPYLIGALSQASGNFYSAMWLMAGTLGLAAAAAACVTEKWAAKYSLTKDAAGAPSKMFSSRKSSLTFMSTMLGDAGMTAAAADVVPSVDEEAEELDESAVVKVADLDAAENGAVTKP